MKKSKGGPSNYNGEEGIFKQTSVINACGMVKIDLLRKFHRWDGMWSWRLSWLKSRCWCECLEVFLVE